MTTTAVCILNGKEGKYGTISFCQCDEDGPCYITGTVEGLSPGKHGFHIHQFGDLVNGCTSTGPHFNPMEVEHGGPKDCPCDRHYGDLGNIIADRTGVAEVDIEDDLVTLYGPDSVVGRAVVVHAGKDDLGRGKNAESKLTGNAGARLACGIIGLTQSN